MIKFLLIQRKGSSLQKSSAYQKKAHITNYEGFGSYQWYSFFNYSGEKQTKVTHHFCTPWVGINLITLALQCKWHFTQRNLFRDLQFTKAWQSNELFYLGKSRAMHTEVLIFLILIEKKKNQFLHTYHSNMPTWILTPICCQRGQRQSHL